MSPDPGALLARGSQGHDDVGRGGGAESTLASVSPALSSVSWMDQTDLGDAAFTPHPSWLVSSDKEDAGEKGEAGRPPLSARNAKVGELEDGDDLDGRDGEEGDTDAGEGVFAAQKSGDDEAQIRQGRKKRVREEGVEDGGAGEWAEKRPAAEGRSTMMGFDEARGAASESANARSDAGSDKDAGAEQKAPGAAGDGVEEATTGNECEGAGGGSGTPSPGSDLAQGSELAELGGRDRAPADDARSSGAVPECDGDGAAVEGAAARAACDESDSESDSAAKPRPDAGAQAARSPCNGNQAPADRSADSNGGEGAAEVQSPDGASRGAGGDVSCGGAQPQLDAAVSQGSARRSDGSARASPYRPRNLKVKVRACLLASHAVPLTGMPAPRDSGAQLVHTAAMLTWVDACSICTGAAATASGQERQSAHSGHQGARPSPHSSPCALPGDAPRQPAACSRARVLAISCLRSFHPRQRPSCRAKLCMRLAQPADDNAARDI